MLNNIAYSIKPDARLIKPEDHFIKQDARLIKPEACLNKWEAYFIKPDGYLKKQFRLQSLEFRVQSQLAGIEELRD
ncbi:hypothetical protein [Maribellus sp. YY47]|uniref:hypothetical protein n=1 Tax=Maribellus sp. YY47 TaxID=2929486 RepID=UPI0020018385|nr:hypothetical protein [Maribellus sp. YY47]MCK3684059.1 hypothetical protein [Maribellus sp. YY47]